MLRPAVFLDRDGVIIENRAEYVTAWEEVAFLPGACAALRRLAATPYAIVIVTNQSPIGRGLLAAAEVVAIHQRVVAAISAAGGRVDASYLCPHRPDEGCACRKPAPGLLLQAAADLGLDLARSYMVGDAVSDLQAGLAAGGRPILVRTGRGARHAVKLAERGLAGCPVVADLAAAVEFILTQVS